MKCRYLRTIYMWPLAMVAVMILGCAESSEKSGKKSNNGANNNGNGGNWPSNDDLCTGLGQQQIAADLSFRDLINELCGGLLTALRSESNQYRGSGTPNIQPQAVQKGTQSQMRLFASMATRADAKSYYNLMRLQISRPDDFKSQGFEYDSAIKYEILSNNGNSVSYHYTNRKEELVVEYNATSVFVEAIPNKLYLVTSKMDKSLGIVKTFRGLQVIYQNSGSAGQYAEVFSMSDQLYDNNDDHDTTVSKARNEFIQDMARGYRNSEKAQLANSYFP